MQYKISIQIGEHVITKEASADLAVNILAQIVLEENIEVIKLIPLADEPTEEELDKSIENVTGGGPAKKKYKARKAKAEKVAPAKKAKRGGKRTVTDVQIYEVLNLKKASHTIEEIVQETKLSKSTVYRITSGGLKPENKQPVNSETPTKVGERQIDKKPEILTDAQWTEAKEAFDDGMTAGAIGFSMQVDIDEIRRAVKCENYTEYTAKY